jgi:SAM-dependent methyltransferase
MTLREAWTTKVSAEDYEAHMARIGQAEANAGLLRDLLLAADLAPGGRVLIAGVGPGQMFNYLPEDFFAALRLTCSDLNPVFLQRLRTRCNSCETVIDDLENSQLPPGWEAIALVLVLEHVDWRLAVQSLVRLQPENLLLIVQRNPVNVAAAVTPGRTPPGTMAVFAEEAPPHLIPVDELLTELSGHGFVLNRVESRSVQDGKSMVGLALRKQQP